MACVCSVKSSVAKKREPLEEEEGEEEEEEEGVEVEWKGKGKGRRGRGRSKSSGWWATECCSGEAAADSLDYASSLPQARSSLPKLPLPNALPLGD